MQPKKPKKLMKLIIGLGNPDSQYAHNRHNAGFLCVDFLQKEFGFEVLTLDKKMSAAICSGMLNTEKVLLVKPDTFMNNSGTAVQTLLNFYKLSPSDIIVIHDDLDIAPGTYKTTLSSRAAGHNGVQDIIDKLGTQDFFRIRLGIGRPLGEPGTCLPETLSAKGGMRAGISTHDFVLQNFSSEEFNKLQELFPQVKEEILHWLDI